MANYVLTSFTSTGDFETVVSALEVQLETLADTTTIHSIGIEPVGHTWHGWLIYNT